MKIFYIDPQSYNNLSLYDYSLLRHVAGHQLTYFYSDMYQLEALPCADARCWFHYSRKKLGVFKALSYVLSIIRILFAVILERPDVVHVQWLRLWHFDYVFAWAIRRLGARLVFTAHNILPHVSKPSDFGHYKKYYALVDEIIVHNSNTRQELADQMQVSPSKISVVRHGVFTNPACESSVELRAAELRQQLHINPDQIVFACLGVQKPYKGTPEIIDVWANTPELRDNPAARLLIVGRNHGLDYSPLSSCENAYVLDEMISDTDFEAYLSISSVVMLTYRKISQSGLLFSAVNRRVPVLITDVGGLPEALTIGKIGWSIGCLDTESLRQSMVHLATHPEEVASLKAQNAEFDKVIKAYDWKEIGEQTSVLYAGLVS